MMMLEKCARAVCPYKEHPCPGSACGCCVRQAKAVLEAIREPDEGMREAAILAIVPMYVGDPPIYESVWQAMIDRILEGGE